MIDTVQQGLGKKYPRDPAALVTEHERVIGPFLAEIRERFNKLRLQVGMQFADNVAAIEAIDTTGFPPFLCIIDSELGDVYSLQAGSPGAGDLQAIPSGYIWAYEYSL